MRNIPTLSTSGIPAESSNVVMDVLGKMFSKPAPSGKTALATAKLNKAQEDLAEQERLKREQMLKEKARQAQVPKDGGGFDFGKMFSGLFGSQQGDTAKANPANVPVTNNTTGFKNPLEGVDMGGILKTLNQPGIYKIASALAMQAGDKMDAEGGSGGGLRDYGLAHLDTADKAQKQANIDAELAEKKRQADLEHSRDKKDPNKDLDTNLSAVDAEMIRLGEHLKTMGSGFVGGSGEWLSGAFADNAKSSQYSVKKSLLMANIARNLGGERGVLTDKDIQRIEAMFPKLTDGEKEREAKIREIRTFIRNRGLITKGISADVVASMPGAVGDTSVAGDTGTNNADAEALDWAKKHPDNLKAKKILKLNGVK